MWHHEFELPQLRSQALLLDVETRCTASSCPTTRRTRHSALVCADRNERATDSHVVLLWYNLQMLAKWIALASTGYFLLTATVERVSEKSIKFLLVVSLRRPVSRDFQVRQGHIESTITVIPAGSSFNWARLMIERVRSPQAPSRAIGVNAGASQCRLDVWKPSAQSWC